jgi:hypothetical protein
MLPDCKCNKERGKMKMREGQMSENIEVFDNLTKFGS